MKKKINEICFLIPAYNEENTIIDIIKRLKKLGDVLVVDDSSTDLTNQRSKRAGAKVIKHKFNLGYDECITTGFRYALYFKYKFLVSLDADGQHRHKDVKKILYYLNKDNIIVYGNRKKKQRFAENFFSIYSNFFYGVRDPLCGLKGYNLKFFKSKSLYSKNYIGTRYLINVKKKKLKTKEIDIKTNKRVDWSRFGESIHGNLKIFKVLLFIIIKEIQTALIFKKEL